MGVRRIKRLLLCSGRSRGGLSGGGRLSRSFGLQTAAAGQRHARSVEPDELEPVRRSGSRARSPSSIYRSGNWLWMLNSVWAVLLPGLLAFSGFSARLRNVAARLGRVWFFTIGLYVVMYLAIVFLVDLPLSYYEGYVRLHAYGLSNQTLGKWFGDSVIRLAISMVGGLRSGLGSLSFACSQPEALVVVHDDAFGTVSVRGAC